MNDVLLATEVVGGVLIIAIVAFLALTLIRRRLIAGSTVPMQCALRLVSGRWRSGLLKLTHHNLEWYPLFGFTWRPRYVWPRYGLEPGETGPPDGAERRSALIGITAPLRVSLSADAGRGPAVFDLTLSAASYTALRAWLEAASPPDRRFDV